MTWRELSADQLNKLKCPVIVDVRSPCEYNAERIVGSHNVPLLSDDERAEVGTLYKQQGEQIARRHAVRIISPKIPSLIDRIVELREHGSPLVVHCWRGGLRSEAVCSLLSVAGIDTFRLTGGYKAWRQQMVRELESGHYSFEPIVLHGLTGSGKTDVLKALKALGNNVLDLEALANHRGSVFGGLGQPEQPSQKDFEAMIWQTVRHMKGEPLFLEAESRKIGRLSLPDRILASIKNGVPILVTGSLEERARRIAEDYLNPARNPAQEKQRAIALLHHLKDRLGKKFIAELESLVTAGDVEQAVKLMLSEYYDPLYSKQLQPYDFQLEVSGTSPAEAAETISTWLKNRPTTRSTLLTGANLPDPL